MKIKSVLLLCIVALSTCTVYSQNVTDGNGKKQGEWIKKDNKGRIIYKGVFKDDYPVDTFYYYDAKGRVELKSFFSDKGEVAYSRYLYPNGNIKAEGKYINKQKDSVWVYYTEKGVKISEENYKNNLKHGTEKIWNKDGKTVVRATEYKNGKKYGEEFENLYSEGYYTVFYKNDKKDGDYKEYYSSKRLRQKGQYSDGYKQGIWEVYDSFGNIVQKLFYKNDTLTDNKLLVNVQLGVFEISQSDIAMIRPAGKQTQLVLLNGDRINCFNSSESITDITDKDMFMQIDAKTKTYLNINIVRGCNSDGSVKTTVDLGYKIIPDKDGRQLLKTLFGTNKDGE